MADAALFSTAAEVIPVLFLIIVFETRHELTPTPGADLAVIGLATFALVVGEAAALHVTSTGQPTDVHRAVVTVALSAGTSAIFYLVMAARMLENPWILAHRRAAVVLIVAYGSAVIVALLLVT